MMVNINKIFLETENSGKIIDSFFSENRAHGRPKCLYIIFVNYFVSPKLCIA